YVAPLYWCCWKTLTRSQTRECRFVLSSPIELRIRAPSLGGFWRSEDARKRTPKIPSTWGTSFGFSAIEAITLGGEPTDGDHDSFSPLFSLSSVSSSTLEGTVRGEFSSLTPELIRLDGHGENPTGEDMPRLNCRCARSLSSDSPKLRILTPLENRISEGESIGEWEGGSLPAEPPFSPSS
uniref:Uncharacterized protein n=1 Tax=Rodentolepis nana TaxID=102285 RepID=A0A158QH39_RODNA